MENKRLLRSVRPVGEFPKEERKKGKRGGGDWGYKRGA